MTFLYYTTFVLLVIVALLLILLILIQKAGAADCPGRSAGVAVGRPRSAPRPATC